MTNPTLPQVEQAREVPLPCPFCGAEPMEQAIHPHEHAMTINGFKMPDYPGGHVVECGCGAGLIAQTRAEVVAMWNCRATPTEQVPAGELPPLPKPCYPVGTGETLVGYSSAQMREYARAAQVGTPAPEKESERDAARYRWLRDQSVGQWDHPITVEQHRSEWGVRYVGPLAGKSLDKAIDAAMQSTPSKS